MASWCFLSRWRSPFSSSPSSSVAALANRTLLCFSSHVSSPHWRQHQSFFSSQAECLKEDGEAGPLLQGAMDVSHPTYMVWGANTGVGKTLVSAGLSAAVFSQSRTCKSQGGAESVPRRRLDESNEVLFVKPVQTGFPSDSDARFVFREVSRMAHLHPRDIPRGLVVSNHTLRVSSAVRRAVQKAQSSVSSDSALDIGGFSTGMTDICSYESQLLQGLKFENAPQKLSESDAVASNSMNGIIEDDVPTGRPRALQSHFTCKTVWAWSNPVSPHLASMKEGSAVPDSLVLESLQGVLGSLSEISDKAIERDHTSRRSIRKWAIVETAGGVASPGPSGTLQCDLYRPLRIPGILVGDGRLGGISTTIGAYESLCSRGYDIPAIILVDAGLSNEEPLQQYLQHKVPVLVLPPLPQDPNESLAEWFAIAEETFAELCAVLKNSHLKRLRRLKEMPKKASQILWWPFTQHDLVPEESITLIDSRLGDNFSVYKGGQEFGRDTISLQFDACASWWTQGPDASLQSELARAAAHTAGRYGHVMFPENVHEPGLQCAELLLQGVGRGWADRVFYSDNGATAVEVAIKMAFRKYIIDHNLRDVSSKHNKQQFKVLALKGSYHGDTLGALEAQAPSAYTGFLQQPWYSGRGLFLEPPTVSQQDGRWFLHLPDGYSTSADIISSAWNCRDEIFDMCRNSTPLAKVYSEFIVQHLSSSAAREESTSIAALITELVIHGAGGMEMLDPLFQRILVQECRKRRIPVIFDEVLSGCWRFGTESAAELLGCSPDIACYSKLLTGGLVPLSATLATKSVFEAFRGVSKLDALLHGHSYTAHAIGCSSAVTAIKYFSDPSRNANLLPDGRRLRELWCPELVSEISSHHAVQRVVSLGTVMALELRASSADGGYGSMISNGLVEGLRLNGIYTRPLGNVVYLMCGPLTRPETCRVLLQRLLTLLEDYPVQSVLQR